MVIIIHLKNYTSKILFLRLGRNFKSPYQPFKNDCKILQTMLHIHKKNQPPSPEKNFNRITDSKIIKLFIKIFNT